MKQFSFSLDRVLDFKNQMLDREKSTLGQLRQSRQALENQMLLLQAEFERIHDEMQDKTQRSITAFELRGYQFQLDATRYEEAELQEQIGKLECEIEAQLAIVLEMSQDVSGLDKLKEHQLSEHNIQVAKAEETEIAEFVSGKLIRQREA